MLDAQCNIGGRGKVGSAWWVYHFLWQRPVPQRVQLEVPMYLWVIMLWALAARLDGSASLNLMAM